MISTPFWIGTGFMKCVLTTLEGAERSVGSLVVAAAIFVIEMEEVLVARIACDGHICASCAKMLDLRAGISYNSSGPYSTCTACSKAYWDCLDDEVDS